MVQSTDKHPSGKRSPDPSDNGPVDLTGRNEMSLKQKVRVIASVGLGFVLIAALVQSYRSQSETQKQLTELKAQMDASKEKPPAESSASSREVAVIVRSTSTAPAGAMERQKSFDEIMDVGWKLVNQRDPKQAEKAIAIFSEGLKNVAPDSVEFLNGLGRANLIAHHPVEAIGAWRTGMAKDPKSSIMQSGIGWAYWNLKDYARARQSWNDALALDPKNVDAWAAMAWIDLAMGKTAESKKGFQELVAFNREKKDWVLGLSMAQGGNNDLKQINSFFPLPPLESFNSPLVPDPAASQPAATNP